MERFTLFFQNKVDRIGARLGGSRISCRGISDEVTAIVDCRRLALGRDSRLAVVSVFAQIGPQAHVQR